MRSKYINTFDTTSEFDNYIESAEPRFPNVALTKDTGDVHYTSTSPNDHLIYGTIEDPTSQPLIWFNDSGAQTVTAHVDVLDNTFYLDETDMSGITTPITALNGMFHAASNNITSLKKLNIDTSSCTTFSDMFRDCAKLKYVNLAGLDISSLTTTKYMFRGCNIDTIDLSDWSLQSDVDHSYMFYNCSVSDIYITEESTLMILTNNLTAAQSNNIPSSATIHYNNQLYKWQNGTWTLQ